MSVWENRKQRKVLAFFRKGKHAPRHISCKSIHETGIILRIDGQKICVTYQKYMSHGEIVETLAIPESNVFIFVCGRMTVRIIDGRLFRKDELKGEDKSIGYKYLIETRRKLKS